MKESRSTSIDNIARHYVRDFSLGMGGSGADMKPKLRYGTDPSAEPALTFVCGGTSMEFSQKFTTTIVITSVIILIGIITFFQILIPGDFFGNYII